MIDLHSHTTNSDGTWTTKELLTKAEEIGLEVLNCTFDGIKIEVLAYNFDLHPIQEWLENYYTPEKNRNRLIEEFNDLVGICNAKRIKIENNLKYNPDTEYPVDVIYYSIVKFEENKKFFTKEQWENRGLFFRTCTVDKNFPLYRDFSKQMPTLEFLNNLIHEYNGKIFLAHLYLYQLEDHIAYLDKIIDKGSVLFQMNKFKL